MNQNRGFALVAKRIGKAPLAQSAAGRNLVIANILYNDFGFSGYCLGYGNRRLKWHKAKSQG